ncbi:transposase [Geobacillus zalihae]|nr:transposase [Geobacillus zalihae]
MLVRLELDEAKQRLLFGFFETYLRLSEEEEAKPRHEVSQMETKEAKRVMELIVSYEQRGLEKGIQQGMKGYDVDTIHELTGLPIEKIERMKG